MGETLNSWLIYGTATLVSPLSHIGEVENSTSLFVREPKIQDDGTIDEVLFYSGAAFKGQLRRHTRDYMHARLGYPKMTTDAMYLLSSGGKFKEGTSVNVAQARDYRETIPLLALFGYGTNKGKLKFGNLTPVCREALPSLLYTPAEEAEKRSIRTMTVVREGSRMDDMKDPDIAQYVTDLPALGDGDGKKAKPTQMRMGAEMLIAGTVMETDIHLLYASDIELGCLVSALHEFSKFPALGGKTSVGAGRVKLDYTIVDLETGESQPFMSIGNQEAMISDLAQSAFTKYNEHVDAVFEAYNGALITGSGAIRSILAGA